MRIRVVYEKRDGLRYTSALDVQKIWERSFRRADVDLIYTQGFHPHPKMQIALPLPLGYISSAEILDIWIEDSQDPNLIKKSLTKYLPKGIHIKKILPIDNSEKPLVNRIESANYFVELLNKKMQFDQIQEKISLLFEKESILRTRRKKVYDLLPLILDLAVYLNEDSICSLKMVLLSEPGKTGRPDEVLDELGINLTDCVITRTAVKIKSGKESSH